MLTKFKLFMIKLLKLLKMKTDLLLKKPLKLCMPLFKNNINFLIFKPLLILLKIMKKLELMENHMLLLLDYSEIPMNMKKNFWKIMLMIYLD